MNLVDLLINQVGPGLISTVGQLPGVGTEKAQTAVGAAIPALLASFTQLGATPSGAAALDASATRAAGQTVAPVGPAAGPEAGTGLLGSLLGEGRLHALAAAVASYANLNTAHATSLIGLAGPLVLGFLGRQGEQSSGQGLASLLAEQKDAITASLPPGLSKLLGSSGVIDQAAWAGHAGGDAVGKARAAWVKPAVLVGAAVLAALALWQLATGPGGPGTAQQAAGDAQPSAGAAGPSTFATVGNVDIGRELASSLSRLDQTFASVTDVSSAQAAVPQLQTVAATVDRLKALSAQLQAGDRSALVEQVARALPAVQTALDRAYAIPGVARILQPVVDPLMGSLADLAKRPV